MARQEGRPKVKRGQTENKMEINSTNLYHVHLMCALTAFWSAAMLNNGEL